MRMEEDNPKLDWNAFSTLSFHFLQCLWSRKNEEERRRELEEELSRELEEERRRELEEGIEKDEDGESY